MLKMGKFRLNPIMESALQSFIAYTATANNVILHATHAAAYIEITQH